MVLFTILIILSIFGSVTVAKNVRVRVNSEFNTTDRTLTERYIPSASDVLKSLFPETSDGTDSHEITTEQVSDVLSTASYVHIYVWGKILEFN